MRNGTAWRVPSGLLLATIGLTAIARGETATEAYKRAQEKLAASSRHHSLRDYSAAIPLLDRVIQTEPKHKAAYRCRGFAHLLTGNPEAAIRDFDQALRLDPADAVLYYGRASGQRLLGRTNKALTDFREAVRQKPGYRAALSALGVILAERGMWRERHEMEDREAKLLASEDSATELRDAADIANGKNFDLDRFLAYHFWLMIYVESRSYLIAPAGASADEKQISDAETLRYIAVRHAVERELGGALASLDRAIKVAPSDWRAYRLRAAISVVNDEPRAALASLTKAIEFSPNEPWLYIDRGVIYSALDESDNFERDMKQLDRISDETMKRIDRRGGVNEDDSEQQGKTTPDANHNRGRSGHL
jgi:tetratricopeptide (TPR) repeat protein